MSQIPVIAQQDSALLPYAPTIIERQYRYKGMLHLIRQQAGSLFEFATQHQYLGLNYSPQDRGWWYREWAPNARGLFLTGDFNGWNRTSHPLRPNERQIWEIFLPDDQFEHSFAHNSLFKVTVYTRTGAVDRIPALAKRVVQDSSTHDFSAQVWKTIPYVFKHKKPTPKDLLIYEAHVGMAQEREGVGTFIEFREKILPRIKAAGYNCIQLMAVQEHPYYGSYGYHVSSFFAPSSRFGSPEELKELIDACHGMGIAVIMDLVHSHAVKNLLEGLAEFDGTETQYFLPGEKGYHSLWDSRLFNYGKWEVIQFLLSNIRYWLEEFNFDGFRFDGVTSMLYEHHGINTTFLGLDQYFDEDVNNEAFTYLQLANTLIDEMGQANGYDYIRVAEDVSGMPGLCRPAEEGGIGFSHRLGMGLPDFWIRLVREKTDEEWDMYDMFYTLVNRRRNEKTVAYAESHDQALVGDQTLAFRLMGPHMYEYMHKQMPSLVVDRGMALHKMIRLATLALGGEAWLNFMGNEFGHPDWIDFPREGNAWSYRYARRQWSLVDSPDLRFHQLGAFDHAMVALAQEFGLLHSPDYVLEAADNALKILSFSRAGLLFIFNWHPTESQAGLPIKISQPGIYRVVLTTDEASFGGANRIAADADYPCDLNGVIRIYAPARTGIVLARQPQG